MNRDVIPALLIIINRQSQNMRSKLSHNRLQKHQNKHDDAVLSTKIHKSQFINVAYINNRAIPQKPFIGL